MCDSKIISKISEEQLREIIERVRRKKKMMVRKDSKKEELDIVPIEQCYKLTKRVKS
jgi:hypothetical protein